LSVIMMTPLNRGEILRHSNNSTILTDRLDFAHVWE
jgi:hypothetical protein